MEKIFGIALFLGIAACIALGQAGAAFIAATQAASEAVTLCLGLVGGCALWGGLVRMADGAGLSRGLSRILRPVLSRLMPEAGRDPAAREADSAAFAANMMGIGNAATPLAMAAMRKLSPRDADTFWLISASSLQVIPTTVLAMRQAAGAAQPADILPVCIIASVLATATAILLCPKRRREKMQPQKKSAKPTWSAQAYDNRTEKVPVKLAGVLHNHDKRHLTHPQNGLPKAKPCK